MQLPLSKTQIGKLGSRLLHTEPPNPDDVATLRELLLAYSAVLVETVDLVSNHLRLEPVYRTKTQDTILEKLRRGGGHWLRDVQDIAGMRTVTDRGRQHQDELVTQLEQMFQEYSKDPRVIDRRHTPSHGYRAVHVIVFPHGIPVEIQVRTRLQHGWAEAFERLADLAGRGIRYGEPPEFVVMHSADRALWIHAPAKDPTTEELCRSLPPGSTSAVDTLIELSEQIARHEERTVTRRHSEATREHEREIHQMLMDLTASIDELASARPDEMT